MKGKLETRLDNDARAGVLQAISLIVEGVYSEEELAEARELVTQLQDRINVVHDVLVIKTDRLGVPGH